MFQPPVLLESFKFVSGNAEHPSDRFLNTTCEVFLEDSTLARRLSKLPRLKDDYFTVGGFDNFGIAEGVIGPEVGKVKKFRLTINSSSENWAILSEIYFKKVSWSFYFTRKVIIFGNDLLVVTSGQSPISHFPFHNFCHNFLLLKVWA